MTKNDNEYGCLSSIMIAVICFNFLSAVTRYYNRSHEVDSVSIYDTEWNLLDGRRVIKIDKKRGIDEYFVESTNNNTWIPLHDYEKSRLESITQKYDPQERNISENRNSEIRALKNKIERYTKKLGER